MRIDRRGQMDTTCAALLFDDERPIAVGGLTLLERAERLAHRARLSPVRIWAPSAPSAPLAETDDNEALVIVRANVLFEQAVLEDLIRVGEEGDKTATAAFESGVPLLLYLPKGAAADIRTCRSLDAMVASLERRGAVRELPHRGAFCRRVSDTRMAHSMERAFIRHLNGGSNESFFTKQIRRFSGPLTSRLVRLGASPTQVTLGGLILAIASAWCIARGSYGAGVLGGFLSYASMVFDCSDGEVARLTVRDSPSGAWLETMVDYTTYFLLLAALTVSVQNRSDAHAYRAAAGVALAGSVLVVVVTGYLRRRVAADDPGQFDEASARVMASASRFHRFASWSRQWIKRSSVAHLVLVLALVNQLPILLYLWAFGATVAAVVIVAVEPFVVRRVTIARAPDRPVEAKRQEGARSCP